MTTRLTIAPDFQSLCPALTEEEARLLEESLLEDGCREPIAVWKCNKQMVIVDGHNRYAICTKHRIAYKLHELTFDSRQAAMGWAARNQLGRRNVTEEQRSYLRGKLYRETKLQVGEHPPEVLIGQNVQSQTSAQIAAETGVTERTVRRDEKYSEAIDALAEKSPALKEAALRGDLPKSSVADVAELPKREIHKLEQLEGKELRKAVREATAKPDYGKCPNCMGTKWTEGNDGVACAKCFHPQGEPAGDVDDDRLTTQRQKTVKTVEAAMRGFDDLQAMKSRKEHVEAIAACKGLLQIAKRWK